MCTLSQIEEMVNDLKNINQVIDGVIVQLKSLQEKKINGTVTEQELSEYRTIKEVVHALQSVA